MDIARIAALLRPFLRHPLSESQLKQISIYIDLLRHWNSRINLTAIRSEEEIVTRHFGESFFMASHLFPTTLTPSTNCDPAQTHLMREAGYKLESKDPDTSSRLEPMQGIHPTVSRAPRVTDIGSGAGFPGIPLKIWATGIDLTLIESNHKKAAFLREATRALTLTDVNVIADRAEQLAVNPSFVRADVVTLRAVERFETVLPVAVELLVHDGRLSLLIGSGQLPLLVSSRLQWAAPKPLPQAESKVLIIGTKVGKP